MNKNIFKVYLKRDRKFILLLLFCAVILQVTITDISKLIMFLFTVKIFYRFGSKDFKMFISFSCTRKKYYMNKIKSSLIKSLFLSILCTTFNLFGKEINNGKSIIIIFLFYFIFYILFSSIEIFIEILSISQYVAVEFGMIFLYFPLYIRFILIEAILLGDTQWILNNFIPYFWGSLAAICFNMFIASVALKTTEI
ncbi:ABC-2 type transport system permease protein [Clostridium tetanomorphum]|uniref:Uncharacterized protein n=1 Tax=Clostridium tetanomorphum TaxID=1553 RepID=A0A923E7J7_CLOTT|nr:hypothetical protein [Clostridium tetanomorphum]MBC2396697.1 hypothetical protein [Clostridium tetanomorphum]MBP1866166.1 ABC-2 type transport system permease protein [Clostridium tetanomorphum]NRS85145.1 ABC-2 type transport system permease protein [Clostridium tetanomorphum]NRZ98326.1 ABC-2 type transport system permease protein [Clostridium tetanomorphum]